MDSSTQWRQRNGVRRSSFWPDADEELLLRAVLGDDSDAVAAIDEWQQTVDIDRMSYGSYRLIPMLYRNAARLGVPLEHSGIVSGIYRRSWYRNTILLNRAVLAINALAESGIESMPLKGTALMLCYYDDRGVRPLGDVDVLVRQSEYQRALDVLADHGWTKAHYRQIPALPGGLSLRHPSGEGKVDLHRTLSWEYLPLVAESALWENSLPAELGGVRVFVQAPEDLLLHILAHGIAAAGGIRWVADALTVIIETRDLDWDRLVTIATARHITYRVSEGLEYVADTFDAPIPKEVRRRLQESGRSGWERRESVAYERWISGNLVWESVRLWYLYRRRCAVEGRRSTPWGFLRTFTEASDRSRAEVVRGALRAASRNRATRRHPE